MTNVELITKVIGKVTPIGESNEDSRRLENLKETCHLVEMLLLDISDMAFDYRNDNRYSVKKMVDYAHNFLTTTVRDLLPGYPITAADEVEKF